MPDDVYSAPRPRKTRNVETIHKAVTEDVSIAIPVAATIHDAPTIAAYGPLFRIHPPGNPDKVATIESETLEDAIRAFNDGNHSAFPRKQLVIEPLNDAARDVIATLDGLKERMENERLQYEADRIKKLQEMVAAK